MEFIEKQVRIRNKPADFEVFQSYQMKIANCFWFSGKKNASHDFFNNEKHVCRLFNCEIRRNCELLCIQVYFYMPIIQFHICMGGLTRLYRMNKERLPQK